MKTLRIASAVAAAIIGGLIASSTPAQADAAVQQRFAAVSGDNCRYGHTEGILTWQYRGSPAVLTAVNVTGHLWDRPLDGDPSTVCRDDRFYSMVKFTAYAGNIVVDQGGSRVDNSVDRFQFTLGDNTSVARIDRVAVQVCRAALYTTPTPPPGYCGPAVQYRVPIIP